MPSSTWTGPQVVPHSDIDAATVRSAHRLLGDGPGHMANDKLRQQSIEQALERVQALAAVGSADQIRSVMAVLARCTVELADALHTAVGAIATASEQVRATAQEVSAFNRSTTSLTKQLIRLNRILTWATVLIALGTLAAAVATVLAFLTGTHAP